MRKQTWPMFAGIALSALVLMPDFADARVVAGYRGAGSDAVRSAIAAAGWLTAALAIEVGSAIEVSVGGPPGSVGVEAIATEATAAGAGPPWAPASAWQRRAATTAGRTTPTTPITATLPPIPPTATTLPTSPPIARTAIYPTPPRTATPPIILLTDITAAMADMATTADDGAAASADGAADSTTNKGR